MTHSFSLACLAVLIGECGPSPQPLSSAKAITAFSIPPASAVIDENAKTISLTLPCGTDVTALVANFTTTGVTVKVGNTVQVSGATANNFTTPVAYTVFAADGSSVTYTVKVSVTAIATSRCIDRPGDCSWTGSATGTAGPVTITANPVTLQFDHADGNQVSFKPVSGTATEAEIACSIAPGTQQIDSANSGSISLMTIDYDQNPAAYTIIAGTQWQACLTCPPAPQFCSQLGGPWCGDVAHPVQGFVSADGKTIEGTAPLTIPSYVWSFTRQYALDITCPQ